MNLSPHRSIALSPNPPASADHVTVCTASGLSMGLHHVTRSPGRGGAAACSRCNIATQSGWSVAAHNAPGLHRARAGGDLARRAPPSGGGGPIAGGRGDGGEIMFRG